jgi:hypothetical protein
LDVVRRHGAEQTSERAMSSFHDVQVSYNDSAVPGGGDPTLGHALERVFEAQQTLVARRIDLLIEEATAKLQSLVAISVGAAAGAIAALAGWFFVMVGVIDALDDRFPRSGVEIAIGALHIAAGAALAYYLFFWRRTPEVPS